MYSALISAMLLDARRGLRSSDLQLRKEYDAHPGCCAKEDGDVHRLQYEYGRTRTATDICLLQLRDMWVAHWAPMSSGTRGDVISPAHASYF